MDMLKAIVVFLFCKLFCLSWALPAEMPAALTVDVMERCPACDALKREIAANRIKVTTSTVVSKGATAIYYPRVTYTDGHRDGGDRIYNKQCMFKVPLKVIKWKSKED